MINVTTRKGEVSYEEYYESVPGDGPTQREVYRILRKDGAKFTIVQFYGSYNAAINGKQVRELDYQQAVVFCRQHHLPGFDYVNAQVRAAMQDECSNEDPMGSPAQYA